MGPAQIRGEEFVLGRSELVENLQTGCNHKNGWVFFWMSRMMGCESWEGYTTEKSTWNIIVKVWKIFFFPLNMGDFQVPY